MIIKLGAFGVRLDRSCAGGAPGVPVSSMIRLTFYWGWYNLFDKNRVPGWWRHERSFFWGHRKATPMERIDYLIRMNAQRKVLDMPGLPLD